MMIAENIPLAREFRTYAGKIGSHQIQKWTIRLRRKSQRNTSASETLGVAVAKGKRRDHTYFAIMYAFVECSV